MGSIGFPKLGGKFCTKEPCNNWNALEPKQVSIVGLLTKLNPIIPKKYLAVKFSTITVEIPNT